MVSWQGEDGIGGVVTDAVIISQENQGERISLTSPTSTSTEPKRKERTPRCRNLGTKFFRKQIYLVKKKTQPPPPRYFDTHVLSI